MKVRALFLCVPWLVRCYPDFQPVEAREVTVKLCPCPDDSCESLCEIQPTSSGEGAEPLGSGGTSQPGPTTYLRLGCLPEAREPEMEVGDTYYLRVSMPIDEKLKAQDRRVEIEATGSLAFVEAGQQTSVVSELVPNACNEPGKCEGEEDPELVFPVRATGIGPGSMVLKKPLVSPELVFFRDIRRAPVVGLIHDPSPVSTPLAIQSLGMGGVTEQLPEGLTVTNRVTVCSSAPLGESVAVNAGPNVAVPGGLVLGYAADVCPDGYETSVTFPVSSTVSQPELNVVVAGQTLNCALDFDGVVSDIEIGAVHVSDWFPEPGEQRLQEIQVTVEARRDDDPELTPLEGASVVVVNEGLSVVGVHGVTDGEGKVNLILRVAKTVEEFGLVLSVAGRAQKMFPWTGPGEVDETMSMGGATAD